MPKFYSRSYNNSPESGYVLTTDVNGLVSWTASKSGLATASSDSLGGVIVGTGLTVSSTGVLNLDLATASNSNLGGVIVGTGLTISNSGVLSLSGGGTTYTAGPGLTLSGSTFSLMVGDGLTMSNSGVLSLSNLSTSTSTSLGRIIYISASGSDSTGAVGDITKPFKTTYAAKGAAISGDTIHVFPQTFIYNNSDALGNQWNNRQDEINLWKMGVTWYFEPNCKVQMTNQTSTGQNLYLIKPVGGTSSDNCRILGYLEYEAYGVGANSTNGYCYYFDGTPIGTDYGYTFSSESLSINSNTNQPMSISKSTTLASGYGTNIVIKLDTYNVLYSSGQAGSGTAFYLSGCDADLNFSFTFRESINAHSYIFILKNLSTRSIINIKGDKVSNSNKRFIAIVNSQNTINVNIKEIYYGTGVLSGYPSVLSDDSTCSYTLNLTGNLIEYQANSVSGQLLIAMDGIVGLTGSTLNYVGDIYTNQVGGGSGRILVWTRMNNTTVNITGNINYMGTTTTTSTAFIAMGGDKATINFRGRIRGNFGGIIAKPYSGTINIENSNIKSTVPTTTSSVMDNQGYAYPGTQGDSIGRVSIRNSYIEMSSGSNFSNGAYIHALINNSIIINSGTGSGFSNTTAYGKLQLLNSTIISSTYSINYTNTFSPPSLTSSVITSNSQVSSDYNITTLYGNIDVLTNMIWDNGVYIPMY